MLYGSWVLEWQCQSHGDHSDPDSRHARFHSYAHMFTQNTNDAHTQKEEHLVKKCFTTVLSSKPFFFRVRNFFFVCLFVFPIINGKVQSVSAEGT